MTPCGNLLAWIEARGADTYIGAIVGEGAVADRQRCFAGRAPATQLCGSPDEARRWVENEAAALDLPVKWIDGNPQVCRP